MRRLSSVALMLSESGVEPLTSAKIIDISTSAPPGKARMNWSHLLQ